MRMLKLISTVALTALAICNLAAAGDDKHYCGSTRQQALDAPFRVDSPQPGKATVYFIGTGTRMIKLAIMIDGEWIGATGRNDYLAAALNPGIHHVCAASVHTKFNHALLRLSVEADHVYYVKEDLNSAGGWAYNPPTLVLLDEDQGPEAMKHVKPAHR